MRPKKVAGALVILMVGVGAPAVAENDTLTEAVASATAAEGEVSGPRPTPVAEPSALDDERTSGPTDADPDAASSPQGRHASAGPQDDIVEVKKAVRVFQRETAKLGVRGDGESGGTAWKSLGSLWHGRLYEYVRNDSFDAVPHEVAQRGGDRNILRRNQFGFTVSGPVYFPKLYDGRRNTFFTFSYEGTRERIGRSYLTTIPTGQQRSGDFSDLVNKAGDLVAIYDPASTRVNPAFDASQKVSRGNLEYVRDPLPNNQLPASSFDPVAQAALPHLPLPNTDVGPFLRNNYWVNSPEESTPDGILVQVDHNLFKRHKVNVDLAYSNGFRGSARIYPTIANPGAPDLSFADRRLQLTETFSISPRAIYTGRFRVSSRVGYTGDLDSERDIPAELGLQGVSGNVFPRIEFRDLEALGSPTNSLFRNAWNSYRTDHSLNLRRGKHSWTLSTRLTFYHLNTFVPEAPSGYFQFNDEITGLPGIINTGNSFASFLIGQSFRGTATDLPQPSYLRRTSWEALVQDEYDVSPNLTATIGINVDTSSPRVEKFNRQSTVDLQETNPANGRPGALVFAGQDGYGRAFQPYRVRLEPRLSLAWSPTDKRETVLRLSLRQFYRSIGLNSGPFATQGFSVRRTIISPNEQLQPSVVLGDGVPQLDHPLPDLRPDFANDTDADFVAQTSRQPRHRYAALDLERRLPMGLTARLGAQVYRGNDMLVAGSVAGVNAIELDALAYRDALNDESFRRRLRPFPQFQYFFTDGQFPLGHYEYRRANVGVEKRSSHGLTFDFSYSFVREWDDYSGPGVQDYFNREEEWSLSNGLRPHRVSLSYVYELPFGSGKPLVTSPGLLRHVLGNWSVSGFTRWRSGDPIVLQPEFNNTGGVVRFLRVNSMPGVNPHVANQSPELWFNPAAFVDPSDFSIGSVPRTHPTLRNPGWNDHDLSVTKRVPLSAERSLEFLFQGFNFINHANWNPPDPVIGPLDAPNVNAGKIIGSTGGRVVQLGLRFNF